MSNVPSYLSKKVFFIGGLLGSFVFGLLFAWCQISSSEPSPIEQTTAWLEQVPTPYEMFKPHRLDQARHFPVDWEAWLTEGRHIPEIEKCLTHLLNRGMPDDKLQLIIEALAYLGTSEAAPTLVKYLLHPLQDIRVSTFMCLDIIADAHIIEPLRQLWESEPPMDPDTMDSLRRLLAKLEAGNANNISAEPRREPIKAIPSRMFFVSLTDPDLLMKPRGLSFSESDLTHGHDTASAALRTYWGHNGAVYSVGFSPDDNRILSVSHDRTSIIWDTRTARKLIHVDKNAMTLYAGAFSRDGKVVVTGGRGREAVVWNSETGGMLGHTHMQSMIRSVAFDPTGMIVAMGGDDSAVLLWEWKRGKVVRELQTGELCVPSIDFSEKGNLLAAAVNGSRHRVQVFELTSSKMTEIAEFNDFVYAVKFSPDSSSVLVGRESGGVALVNCRDHQQIRAFEGLKGPVFTVDFTPDGKWILAGGGEGVIVVWETATGKQVLKLQGHNRWISHAVFSHDGKFILSGSGDSTARLWFVGDAVKAQETPLEEKPEDKGNR